MAIIKACLYEPQVNRTYAELAAHYDTAVLPARPRRPRVATTPPAARGEPHQDQHLNVGLGFMAELQHRRELFPLPDEAPVPPAEEEAPGDWRPGREFYRDGAEGGGRTSAVRRVRFGGRVTRRHWLQARRFHS